MAGWTKTSTKIRTGSRSESFPKSLPNSSPKPRSLALALLFVAAVATAALGQAPPSQQSDRSNAVQGNSQIEGEKGVSVGVLSSKPGSLSGKLTDLRSTPLEGAAVVLRNTGTGAEVTTVTQKNGTYRFTGLAAGEYTLIADSKLRGQGSLEGILVSAGNRSPRPDCDAIRIPCAGAGRRRSHSSHPVPVPDNRCFRADKSLTCSVSCYPRSANVRSCPVGRFPGSANFFARPVSSCRGRFAPRPGCARIFSATHVRQHHLSCRPF